MKSANHKKTKNESSRSPRKRLTSQGGSNLGAKSEQGPSTEALVETWQNEIEGLRGQKFDSLEAASSAVIESVLIRMQVGKAEAAGIREFLRVMIESDAEMTECLFEALQITRPRE